MNELLIAIEINGKKEVVGSISGDSYADAHFKYNQDYLSKDYAKAISVSLPLQEERFTARQTSNYFEGLLPEGFSRRAVANWAKSDESDYITILDQLGQESIGAISVFSGEQEAFAKYQLLDYERVKALAAEGATTSTQLLVETHLSLTGATGKVGLYYDDARQNWYLPLGNAPSNHIVKQSHVRYQQIVINEQICMEAARKLGLQAPDSFILNVGDGSDGDILYATKRYDRIPSELKVDGLVVPYRLHQEDFAQALGISAINKYETSKQYYIQKMFALLAKVSSNPIEDQLALWDNIIFNYFIGNTDCHLKNYSLLYSPDLKIIRLAPAYDIVCTQAYSSTKQFSLFVGEKTNIDEISRNDFVLAAKEIGLGSKLAMSHYDAMANHFKDALVSAIESVGEKGFTKVNEIGSKIKDSVEQRII